MREVLDNDLPQRAVALEKHIRTEIASWNHPGISEVRGKGLLLGVALNPGSLTIPESVSPSIHLSRELAAAGLLAPPAGGDTVRLMPPLTVTGEHVDEALAILKATLDTIANP
jgi:4-aminobutyrate aminotransferase-like enzyme